MNLWCRSSTSSTRIYDVGKVPWVPNLSCKLGISGTYSDYLKPWHPSSTRGVLLQVSISPQTISTTEAFNGEKIYINRRMCDIEKRGHL